MENINVRARQQLKAAILQFQSIGAKKIVLSGKEEDDTISIAANIPINLANGTVKLSAWMMIRIIGESDGDWCFATEADKLAKRMPKIEGDTDACIDFEYAPKEKGTGANIVFNGRGTAGKRHEGLPLVPLENNVEYLPITYDPVAGAIHFNINTGGSEGMDIHVYVTMNDFGNVLEARAILAQFNIKVEGVSPEAEFAKKEAAPPEPKQAKAKSKSKSKTANKKESDMTTKKDKKDPLTPPAVALGIKTQPLAPPVVDVPPPVVDEEVVPPVDETVVVDTLPVDPPITDAPVVDPPAEEPPVEPAKAKPKRPSNSLSARIERATALLVENNYTVKLNEDEETAEDPLVMLDQVNAALLFVSQTNKKIAALISGPSVDPELTQQLKELVSKL